MPSFPYVKKGDEFKPNMQLDNAVRRIVNQHYQQIMAGGTSKKRGDTGIISVTQYPGIRYEGLPAGSAVFFQLGGSRDGVLYCSLTDGPREVWGVVLEDIDEYGSGSCIVSGVVNAPVDLGDATVTKQYVQCAANGKIVFADSGYPVVGWDGKTGLATIVLGGGSGEIPYNGSFKLVAISDTDYKIIYGEYPDNKEFAGSSDIPGFHKIPQLTGSLKNVNTMYDYVHVYIFFTYDKETKKYSVHLTGDGSPGPDSGDYSIISTYIGKFRKGGSVEQSWTSWDLHYSDRWYLPGPGGNV